MADTTIVGTTLDGPKERDAIHVAVASVVAWETLYPGQHIGIFKDGGTASATADHIGVVDPFLKHRVEPGTWFWLFLYPQTITSLKHNWTHPSFGPEKKVATSPENATPEQRAYSEAWLRDFTQSADCPGYETVIAAAIDEGDRQWDDDFLHFDGKDAHGDIPPEFWDHVEIVTGRKIAKRARHFSCSC